MEAKHVNVQGISIQLEDHGGRSHPILFLHHGGSNLRQWDRLIPYFADAWRCITLDLRGHGKSDAPLSGYHIDDMADDIIGVLDALHLERTHVIGSSIGAEVGLSLAARYPKHVLSLVADGALSSEYGPFSTRDVEDISQDPEMLERLEKRVQTPEKSYDSFEAYLEASSAFYKEYGFWNETVEASLEYGCVKTENGRYVSAWRKHASDTYMQFYFTLRVEDYYAKATCPILMMPDEDDANDEALCSIMKRLAALSPHCEIAHVQGAMHPFGWLTNPEPMAIAAREFIERVDVV